MFFLIRNNMLFFSDIRFIGRKLKNGSKLKLPKKYVATLSGDSNFGAVVFWHVNGYLYCIVNLLNNHKSSSRSVVVIRKVSSCHFESFFGLLFKRFGRDIYFIHSSAELKLLKKNYNTNEFIWVYGAEFLLGNSATSRMMRARIKVQAKPIWFHQPWETNPQKQWELLADISSALSSSEEKISKIQNERLIVQKN